MTELTSTGERNAQSERDIAEREVSSKLTSQSSLLVLVRIVIQRPGGVEHTARRYSVVFCLPCL